MMPSTAIVWRITFWFNTSPPCTPSRAYDYAYRFSVDGGRNWTYCDGNEEGSSEWLPIENAGQLNAFRLQRPASSIAADYQPNGTCAADIVGLPECT